MVAVNHFYDDDLTARTHTDDTNYTFVTGSAQILGSALTANTKYLIIAHAMMGGSSAATKFGTRISTADDSAVATKSEQIIEPIAGVDDQLFPYFFVHSFSTDGTPADVEFQIKTLDSGETARIDQQGLALIDLDDLGSSNFFETIHADDASEYPTTQATEFSIAGSSLGTDEWSVWGYQRTGIGQVNRNHRVEVFTAFDTSTSAVRARDENEGEDSTAPAEMRHTGFCVRHKASSGTPDFEVQTWEENTGADATNTGGYAIALKTSAFADYQAQYTAAATTIDTTERTFQTITLYKPSTTADHLICGMWSINHLTGSGQQEMHIEDDGAEMRTGDESGADFRITYDTTAEPIENRFHQNNILSSDTSTYTLRGKDAADAQEAGFRWLTFLSLELADAVAEARFIRSNLVSRKPLKKDDDRLASTGLISAGKST